MIFGKGFPSKHKKNVQQKQKIIYSCIFLPGMAIFVSAHNNKILNKEEKPSAKEKH